MYGILTCVNGFILWYSKCRNIFQCHGAYGIEVVYFFESPISTSTGPTGQCSKELAEGTCWQLAQFQRTWVIWDNQITKQKKLSFARHVIRILENPAILRKNPWCFKTPYGTGKPAGATCFFCVLKKMCCDNLEVAKVESTNPQPQTVTVYHTWSIGGVCST